MLPLLCPANKKNVHVQEWEVIAEEPLDAVFEPGDEMSSGSGVLAPEGARITWRGDGKYLATVSALAGKLLPSVPQLERPTCCIVTVVTPPSCTGLVAGVHVTLTQLM